MKDLFTRKLCCIIAGMVTMLFFAIQANAQTNLGFETGNTTGWSSSFGASALNTPGYFPAGALTKVGQISTLATNNLYQAFTVTSGNTALTIRYWGSPGGGTTLGIFHIKVFKTTAPGTIYYELTSSSLGSGTVTPIDLSACIGSEVKILFEVAGGSNTYFDPDLGEWVTDPTSTQLMVDASFPAGPPAGAPIAYAITGGGSSCTGSAEVGLANSETGVTYTLSPGATVRTGTTGSAISFGSQPAGTYTASGTSTGGTTPMTGSATVTDIRVTPTFTQLGPYCQNATPGTLPTTSTNSPGITGSWNAAISTASAGTTVYTFTPNGGQCAKTATMSVVVNSNVTPAFTQLGPYLVGTTPGALPTTSTNSITGTWNAAISTASAGTTVYTFTPAAGQCATTATMSVFVFANVTPSPQPPFLWANGIGGDGVGGSAGNCVTTDASGNVYTVGRFNSYLNSANTPMDFDPGAGAYFLTSNGSDDIFITKTDASGNFLWAKSYGGIYSDKATSIAVDGSGNAYVIGEFTNSVDFEGTTLNPEGGTGMFILKLDASGALVWVQGIMGKDPTNNDLISGKSMALDGSGNIYISGLFDAVSMDFNPAPGAASEYLLSSPAPFGDGFIAKYDNSGNFVWAKRLRGNTIEDSYGIALDGSGNVYTTGYYMGTTNFNPGGTYNLSSVSNSYDIYVLKLNSSGVFVWAKSMGGTGGDKGLSIATDASGNVYTTGYFYGTGDFDPSGSVSNLISNGSNDIFISKLDASGNFVWAKSIGGTDDDNGLSLTTDPASNVYVAGSFNGSVDFEPGANYYVLNSAGARDIFVTKFDASGNFNWADSFGSTGDDAGSSIRIDYAGSILITGYFRGTVDFDASGATHNLTAHGSADVFTNKMGISQWTGAINTSWTEPGNWTGGVPGSSDAAIINNAANQPAISTAVVINELTINSPAVLTINASASLTVSSTITNGTGTNGLVILSDATGTGSLINATPSIPATVNRYFPGASTAWHLLSSPVAAQAIGTAFTASPSTSYDFFTWYEPTEVWVNFKNTTVATTWETANGSNNFVQGRGYLVAYTGTGLTKQFTGNLNTGTVSPALTKTGTGTYAGYNLVGNPYASAIDWKAASGWNRTSLVDNSGYDMAIWNDAAGNYCSYNSNGSSGINGGTQYIAAGQGFFVNATSSGILGMNNDIRVHNTQAFLKSPDDITNILRLNVSGNANTYSDEIVVEFGHATAGGGAGKIFSFYETAPSLYTVKPAGNFSIDFRGEPGTVAIPVSFKAGADGSYTLTASQIESFTSWTVITLEDLQAARTQNLMTNPVYTFASSKNDASARFVLHFGGSFGVNNRENQEVSIYSAGNSVCIANHSGSNMTGEVIIYNMIGQVMMKKSLSNGSRTTIGLGGSTGYYLVKVVTGEKVYSAKVFVQ